MDQLCCLHDFEKLALTKLPKPAADYYGAGACGEHTLQLNKSAFQRLRIRPRVLRDITIRDTSCEILGSKVEIPIGVSPSAMQKMAHPEGECANARAVGEKGSVYILSTLSTSSLEEVAEAAPDTIKWFQLYIYYNRDSTKELIKRAENAGYKALVVTVDANVLGLRYADTKNKFVLPPHLRLANFSGKESEMNATSGSALTSYTDSEFDSSVNWEDIKWLKSITNLPIVLKGIQTSDDAVIAATVGVEAIMVSNHGARQLDTAPASIEALPEIARAVGNKCEIYLDGGVRYGTDVFKALALGAKMVFIGRPALWGLACGGQKGVKKVLDILHNEFSITLGLAGCNSLEDITKTMVVHEDYYSKL
uniref:(S)-2-hydroxy-acid oxidase n=1 Tax=Triatoma infestans TaxID=30076 RepID=A0A023F7T5_TRIIF